MTYNHRPEGSDDEEAARRRDMELHPTSYPMSDDELVELLDKAVREADPSSSWKETKERIRRNALAAIREKRRRQALRRRLRWFRMFLTRAKRR